MSSPEDRVHACLDGELTPHALTPAERRRLDALTGSIGAAVEVLRNVPAPDLTADIMGRLAAADATAVPAAVTSGESRSRRGLLSQVVHWLWSPLAIQLRPLYAFAGAGVLGLALWLGMKVESGNPTLVPPMALEPARVVAPPADATRTNPALYVQFRIEIAGASRVAVAGSFTDWRPEYELTEVSPGVWSAMVPLSPGVHDYTFVIDGKRMVVDPYAPRVSDSFGGSNSRLFLPAPHGSA